MVILAERSRIGPYWKKWMKSMIESSIGIMPARQNGPPAGCAFRYGFNCGDAFCNAEISVCASGGACTLFSVTTAAASIDLP